LRSPEALRNLIFLREGKQIAPDEVIGATLHAPWPLNPPRSQRKPSLEYVHHVPVANSTSCKSPPPRHGPSASKARSVCPPYVGNLPTQHPSPLIYKERTPLLLELASQRPPIRFRCNDRLLNSSRTPLPASCTLDRFFELELNSHLRGACAESERRSRAAKKRDNVLDPAPRRSEYHSLVPGS